MIESWLSNSISSESIQSLKDQINSKLLNSCLNVDIEREIDDSTVKEIVSRYELALLDHLKTNNELDYEFLEDAYTFYRSSTPHTLRLNEKFFLIKRSCLGILAERSQEVSADLGSYAWVSEEQESENWGERVLDSTLKALFHVLRRSDWSDVDTAERTILEIRELQNDNERSFLEGLEEKGNVVWRLISLYHLSKGIDLLNSFISTGYDRERFDIREQVESHLDKSLNSISRVFDPSLETLIYLVSRVSMKLIDNSLWSLTRGASSEISDFVSRLLSRDNPKPIFELLPPQRITLKESGLLGANYRSVVVNLPTSSGKTLISEFRILQALSQFQNVNGWVAYLVPTRVLVNQITQRLRKDLEPLGVKVEKASPALTVDSIEESILTEPNLVNQFKVLVTTPEKFDLLIRNGWEGKISRPLTLVVVDEAHNLGASERGVKLELMLATVNRECRHAQFLLLTPFIQNSRQVANWLSPDSNKDVSIEINWKPKDRAVGIVRPKRGTRLGNFKLEFESVHTSKKTIDHSGIIPVFEGRRLGLVWSKVNKNLGNISAVVADLIKEDQSKEGIIILAARVGNCWSIADKLCAELDPIENDSDINLVKDFLNDEFGEEFRLGEFISKGVGIHNSALSDEAKLLVEWLFELGKIKVLVATTTIAQGVNFPVSTVVMASYQYPFGKAMPPEDFWNLAGRVGRIGQKEIGLVCLVSNSDERTERLKDFISTNVSNLNSKLIQMVTDALIEGDEIELHRLFHKPEWSTFLQYLAHTYRQIGDQRDFASEIEQILRGTFGYRELRNTDIDNANKLIQGVQEYTQRLSRAPLGLVDKTGFSPEAVSLALQKIREKGINYSVWDSDDLFQENSENLRELMGVLLEVPELRDNLKDVLGGTSPNGFLLSNIITDWVNGKSIKEIAENNFAERIADADDKTGAIGDCCRTIYRNIVNTASWGISALQSLTYDENLANSFEHSPEEINNIPSQIYYGVSDIQSIALRMNYVPRSVVSELKNQLDESFNISTARQKLSDGNGAVWNQALGRERGEKYFKLWRILNGESV